MTTAEIILIALALAMDATTISFSAATVGFVRDKRAVFRLSFHFGLFQFLMPVLGWFLGMSIVSLIARIDHWIAFSLLSFVGIRMILQAINKEKPEFRADPSRGWQLIGLSIATSIDALAVGLTLAFVNVNIWYVSVIIGMITGGMCVLAISVGYFLRSKFGSGMEILGGIILIAVGLKILLEHLY